MITRRTLEGALKCALRDFRREEDTAVVKPSVSETGSITWMRNTVVCQLPSLHSPIDSSRRHWEISRNERTGVSFGHCCRARVVVLTGL